MSMSISMDLTLASPSSSPSVCAAPVPVPVPVAVPSHLHLDLTVDFKSSTCRSSNSSRENRDRDRDRDSDRDIEPFIAIGETDCVSRRDGPFSSKTTHTTAAPAPEAIVVGSMPFSSPHNRNTASDIKSRNKSPKKVSKFFSKISINVRICPALNRS
jgi:hypothetical protein